MVVEDKRLYITRTKVFFADRLDIGVSSLGYVTLYEDKRQEKRVFKAARRLLLLRISATVNSLCAAPVII